MPQLKIAKCPPPQALSNFVYVNSKDAKSITAPSKSTLPDSNYILIKDYVFCFRPDNTILPGTIGLNQNQRTQCWVSLNESVNITPWIPKEKNIFFESARWEVDFLAKTSESTETFDAGTLEIALKTNFTNQAFCVDQKVICDVSGRNMVFRLTEFSTLDLTEIIHNGEEKSAPQSKYGILLHKSTLTFAKSSNSNLRIAGGDSGSTKVPSLFQPNWSFQSMGIGGLDHQFSLIFRRAFASRCLPTSFVQKLGINHVKGMLLYGPPGTGKTLMARQIGKMLNARPPKIVSGPEVLNKYVGQTEENIRALFADAEAEYKAKGDESELHIIIFDEIDAICKSRGSRSDGTGVGDSLVNQLLAKIDGVEALNNVLVIGMTNRKDMLDEALLRPGRLEVHMEIGLPDEKGRLQIFNIHTAKMRDSGLMDSSVNLEELAAKTKNYSGAEIEGVVKCAASYSLNRQINPQELNKIDTSKIKVLHSDFSQALTEVKPAFGMAEPELENCVRNGLINYGTNYDKLISTGKHFIHQVHTSDRTPLLTVLFEGPAGTGKTAIAASLASSSGFPFVRMISSEQMIGMSETGKSNKIFKIFEDAYKSPESIIVIDDVERVLEYTPIGPRFSNLVLQTFLVLLKKNPPKGRKLLVFGTTSLANVLEEMEFMTVFNARVKVPSLSSPEELKLVLSELNLFDASQLDEVSRTWAGEIAIKKLIMIAEMARSAEGEESSIVDRFNMAMLDYGYLH